MKHSQGNITLANTVEKKKKNQKEINGNLTIYLTQYKAQNKERGDRLMVLGKYM